MKFRYHFHLMHFQDWNYSIWFL